APCPRESWPRLPARAETRVRSCDVQRGLYANVAVTAGVGGAKPPSHFARCHPEPRSHEEKGPVAFRRPVAPLSCGSVAETVDHVIDADLIGLVGFAHRTQPETRPLPELRDVGVVVDDHLQALGWIVVLEQPAEHRTAADAEDLRHHIEVVDLEE